MVSFHASDARPLPLTRDKDVALGVSEEGDGLCWEFELLLAFRTVIPTVTPMTMVSTRIEERRAS